MPMPCPLGIAEDWTPDLWVFIEELTRIRRIEKRMAPNPD